MADRETNYFWTICLFLTIQFLQLHLEKLVQNRPHTSDFRLYFLHSKMWLQCCAKLRSYRGNKTFLLGINSVHPLCAEKGWWWIIHLLKHTHTHTCYEESFLTMWHTFIHLWEFLTGLFKCVHGEYGEWICLIWALISAVVCVSCVVGFGNGWRGWSTVRSCGYCVGLRRPGWRSGLRNYRDRGSSHAPVLCGTLQ